MMQAPRVSELLEGTMSMGTRLRVGLVCVMAISALICAHNANLKHVALEEDPVEVQNEQARVMLRDALIKDAHRVKVTLPTSEPTRIKTVPASTHAYSIRHPNTGAVSLRSALDGLEQTKNERRDRLKMRGEGVRDMDASGHTTLQGVLDDVYDIERGKAISRKKCTKIVRRRGEVGQNSCSSPEREVKRYVIKPDAE